MRFPPLFRDQFAQEFHCGARPGSRQSGYKTSPICRPGTSTRHGLFYDYEQSYDYGTATHPAVDGAEGEYATFFWL